MGYRVDTTEAPTVEPVTLAEAKEQLRVEASFTDDDAYIDRLIKMARDAVEWHCFRFFTVKKVRFSWNESLPGTNPIVLPMTKITDVTKVFYDLRDGTNKEIDSADWTHNPNNNTVTPGNSWPGDSISYQVEVDTAAPVEFEGVRHAILMLITDAYENRTVVVIGSSVNQNPAAMRALAPYREQMGL